MAQNQASCTHRGQVSLVHPVNHSARATEADFLLLPSGPAHRSNAHITPVTLCSTSLCAHRRASDGGSIFMVTVDHALRFSACALVCGQLCHRPDHHRKPWTS